ncbi:hypothetical protein O4J56_07830 [Nocardiopsis sp. RSe5-2]|uniref:Uncharacterized protein n=1 Tax=Nocardiopsis endophytica TaxID=3018445 RepID=A0ABT4U0S7_9ACTN|nr:hypothetical protein [Nocardiopsis endophytica]MDA2810543.1 hypothetical protein [Nocardiopsis endophytica]
MEGQTAAAIAATLASASAVVAALVLLLRAAPVAVVRAIADRRKHRNTATAGTDRPMGRPTYGRAGSWLVITDTGGGAGADGDGGGGGGGDGGGGGL